MLRVRICAVLHACAWPGLPRDGPLHNLSPAGHAWVRSHALGPAARHTNSALNHPPPFACSDGVRLATKPPEQPFCVVRDKAHIATCVLAAQAVLLNPRAVEDTPGGAGAFVPLLSSAQPGRQPAAAAKLLALRDASHYELPFTPNKVRARDAVMVVIPCCVNGETPSASQQSCAVLLLPIATTERAFCRTLDTVLSLYQSFA